MNACIRESNADDCKAVYALICSMEEKQLPPTEFEKIYNAQQKDDSCLCLVCEQEGKAVGCLNLRMEYQLHHAAKIAEIMELSVDAHARCQGIGQKLYAYACRKAKESGCIQIEVCCNRLRTRAHKFYETQGMHNFHYKFSLDFLSPDDSENRLGK